MKKIILKNIVFILIFISQVSFGQRLSLSDLENICNKSNWESVNQFLMNKNWEYYESEKGNSEKYSTITWSFEKTYGDKASAWFYLYTYEGFPNKLSYSVFNKSSYTAIQNSLSSKSYKLQDSEIENNELISTYSNSNFILKITTEKREKDSYSSFDESITAYRFLLIKKSSVYDPDNGKKTDYYYGDTKQAEYTLKNGKINGMLKVYYENGQLKKTGSFSNGLANGNFIEYDEDGNKTYEYYMSNDTKNGKLIAYEDNKISYSSNYTNDILNGERVEYYYSEETGELNLKLIGSYSKGEKNGLWELIYIDKENGDKTLTKTNYYNGLKNGFNQEVKGDSLIIANYNSDKLNGDYKIYVDASRVLFGGLIRTDTTKLVLTTKGKYNDDLKVGHWSYYDLTRTLREEGGYLNGQKNDKWKSYYTSWGDGNGGNMPYSKELYLTQNFKFGKLNGTSKRFSYLNKEKYKCSERDKNNQPIDSCTRMVYEKVLETSNYKNDKLDGLFELRDSINEIVAKGNFRNDLKVGEWFHRYSEEDLEGNSYNYYMVGNYDDDERDGQWILYYRKGEINKTINYSNGELDGEFIEWNIDNKPKEKKQFKNGKLKELVVYDSLGIEPTRKFEILGNYSNNYKCKYTQFKSNGSTSQVYWVKKEEDINHNWFEFSFLLKLNDNDKNIIYKDGEFNIKNESNKPLIKGEYSKNEKFGNWSYYFYLQKVKMEIDYKFDKPNGEKYFDLKGQLFSGDFTYINEEDNIKEIRKIKDGLRNGNTEFLDMKTGKRIKKVKYKDGKIK